MNVLVIGSKGQLAKEFKNSLNSKKLKFIFLGKKKLNIISYRSLNTCVNKLNPSIIINCAAYTDVDNSETKKKMAYNLNCHAVTNLVKICKLKKIYLIHFSTDYVFNGRGQNYTEQDKTDPINYYGKTKKIGEKIIIDNLNSFVIFRLSWLIGSYSNNFLKKIISNLKNKKKIFMVENQISNPTTTIFVSKIVKVCCESYYNKKNIFKGIFHLANEPAISKLEFTKYVYYKLKKFNLMKNDCKIVKISSNELKNYAKRPENSSFNLNKLKRKIIKKNFSWKNILKRILINI